MMPRVRPITLSFALVAALSTSVAGQAHAQAQPAKPTPPAGAPAAPPTAAPATPTPGGAPSTDLIGYRLPLLREGSIITRVTGDITMDPDERHWVFRPIQPESGSLRREFVLLPSPTLEDMLRTRKLSPSPVEFELTGRVYIYKGRNYLFPELAPPIVRFDTRPSQTPTPNVKAQPTPNGQAKFVPPSDSARRSEPTLGKDDDATVEGIERRLESRVARTPVGRASGEGAGAKSAREGGDADTKTELPEAGSRFVLRNGRLLRDPQAGSWRFVPEQVTGSGDSSLEILPCLLLEKLELLTRETDTPPNISISGTVVIFDGAAYLMPSSFRRAREGRGLGR